MYNQRKFFQKELKSLPRFLYNKGHSYKLNYSISKDTVLKTFDNWVCYKYIDVENEFEMPAEATDGKSIYYLCSFEPTNEKAEKDMLERLNTMTDVLTEEDADKLRKEFKEKLAKKRNGKTNKIF